MLLCWCVWISVCSEGGFMPTLRVGVGVQLGGLSLSACLCRCICLWMCVCLFPSWLGRRECACGAAEVCVILTSLLAANNVMSLPGLQNDIHLINNSNNKLQSHRRRQRCSF